MNLVPTNNFVEDMRVRYCIDSCKQASLWALHPPATAHHHDKPNSKSLHYARPPLNCLVLLFYSLQIHRHGKTTTFRVPDVRCIQKPYHLHSPAWLSHKQASKILCSNQTENEQINHQQFFQSFRFIYRYCILI